MTLRAPASPVAAIVTLVTCGAVAHADPLPVHVELLPNGLHVVLAPDPSVSSVVVHVRYGGGATDDHGYAHLVERLMFDGTVHVGPGDFDARIDAAGGWTSSVTTADHVSVFELVPAEALELVLWLEAERMAGLADGITDAGLAREVTAIAAERRAAYGAHGYGLVERTLEHALWPTDGDLLGDGTAPTRAQLRAYIAAHVIPANATLVIAGRFDQAAARALVRRDFAWIPGGALAPPRAADTIAWHGSRRVVADPVPKVAVAVRAFVDAPELAVAAQLLAGRTSRLSHEIIDGGLATELRAGFDHHARGELRVAATARPGVDPERLAITIERAIADLRERELSPDEVGRAVTAVEAELVERLENLAIRADLLAERASGGSLTRRVETARRALRAVTPDSLRQRARTVLGEHDVVTVIGR